MNTWHIIYFHGLDSFLTDEKKEVLRHFGTVTAPALDYRSGDVIKEISELFEDKETNNVLIGSSMGGYVAYQYSQIYQLPCLLFNPALPTRSIDLEIKLPSNRNKSGYMYAVLGKNDDVINYANNLEFINRNIHTPKNIITEESMGHRVPLHLFEKHVGLFFRHLNTQPSPS